MNSMGRSPTSRRPAIDADVARLKKAISDAQAFGDDKLTDQQKYERDYLVAVAKGQLFWIDPDGRRSVA